MVLERLFLLSLIIRFIASQVVVTRTSQVIYDKSLTLKIQGSGFEASPSAIVLEIGAIGQPLTANVDYVISKASYYELTLTLLTNRTWVDLTGRVPPVALYLSSMVFSIAPTGNQLASTSTIAEVLSTPAITESDIILDYSYSELSLFGSGLIGASHTRLYFEPFLYQDVAYEDIQAYPLHTNEIKLKLRTGHHWREDNGPLKLIGIDTGGGVVKQNDGNGVIVAEIVKIAGTSAVTSHPSRMPTYHPTLLPSMPGLGVGVVVYSSTQKVYESALRQKISIMGVDLKPDVVFTFSFNMALATDYVIEYASHQNILLRLQSGKKWPVGPIYLLSVKRDSKTVIMNQKVLIATVLSDPVINWWNELYHESQSHLVKIQGSGFTDKASTRIALTPTLPANYVVHSVTNTTVVLRLSEGAWLPPGISLNNRPDSDRVELAVWSVDTGAGVIHADLIMIGNIYKDIPGATCSDLCPTAYDGVCDDPRLPGVINGHCLGTDCTDCGGVEAMQSLDHPPSYTYEPVTPDGSRFWIFFLIISALCVVVLIAAVCLLKRLQPIVVAPAASIIEMTKYVALPQVESDVSYI